MNNINEIKFKRIFKLSKNELQYLYYNLNMSQTDIAKLLKVDASNVSRKFKKENINANRKQEYISKKQLQNNINLTKEILKKEYPIKSITKIGKKFGVSYSYIYKKLKEFKIPIQKNGKFQKKYIDNMKYDILYDLYWNKNLSMNEIGIIYNTDKNYIKRRLVEYNIKLRTKKEAFNLPIYKNKKIENLKKIIGNDLTKFKPVYNKSSIKIIEDFGKIKGLNLRHAENGGEYFIDKLFYWLDAYDIKKNVIVEFYEDGHKYKKEYDTKRIKKIKEYLKSKIFIIHENGVVNEI